MTTSHAAAGGPAVPGGDPIQPVPRAGAVVFAKDLLRLARFYEHVLALGVTHAETDHVVLAADGFELVVHAIPARIASTIDISTPPQVRENTPVKLFFPVASLAAARAVAAQWGGGLGPAAKEWEARGFRACDGHDPEGNVFQLRQPAPGSPPLL